MLYISEVVYLGESRQCLNSHSDEHKRSVRKCHCDKNEIAKQITTLAGTRRKLLIGKAG